MSRNVKSNKQVYDLDDQKLTENNFTKLILDDKKVQEKLNNISRALYEDDENRDNCEFFL